MIVTLDKIEKSFVTATLYSNVSLQINAKERWALVGPNGAGKTTLLKIVMGIEAPDAGDVVFANGVTVGYLEQNLKVDSHKTALAEVVDSAYEIKTLEKRIAELENIIANQAEGEDLTQVYNEYSHAQSRFEMLGGYELESKARSILAGLGFKVTDFDLPTSEFSGGWQMRLALAKLLLKHPDLLLLDEPTNHLDLESVSWLENFIVSYDGSVLLVSHDRMFMDKCVTHVAALENKQLHTYTGNYTKYLQQRADNLEQLRAKRAAQERDIEHLKTFIERFRYKPTKAKQVQERIKRLEQIESELVVLPEQSKKVHFQFPEPVRTGDMVVELTDVTKTFEDQEKPVYKDVNFTLYRGDHVVIYGPNGAGKSTLLKLIANLLKPSGGSIRLGKNVECGYYAQHQLETLNLKNTVLEELNSVCPSWSTPDQRKLLGAFLFHGDAVFKSVGVLSGGEKARLALAKMLVKPEPLLCLDEPTNHLDIDSVQVLESALKSFDGTLIIVSHDEQLVREVANKVIDVRDGHVTLYDGDFDYFLYKSKELSGQDVPEQNKQVQGSTTYEGALASESKPESKVYKTKEQKRLEAQKRQELHRRFKKVKDRIQEIEKQLLPAQDRMNELTVELGKDEVYNNQDLFNELMSEYQSLNQTIPPLEEEWLELQTQLEEGMNE